MVSVPTGNGFAVTIPNVVHSADLPANVLTALVSGEKSNFQFILRILNTNVDGKQKIMYALTKIKGVGRRYSNLVCKKADVDLNKRYVQIAVSDSITKFLKCWRSHLRRTRTNCHHYPKPHTIQDPYLVPQQTARHQRR